MTIINSRISLIISLFLAMYSCKSAKSNQEDAKSNKVIEEVIKSIGEVNETVANGAGTHTLYIHIDNRPGRTETLSYVVTDIKSGSIVHNDKHAAGYVKWYDDYRLEVLKSTEMLQPGEKLSSRVLLIDVRSQDKILKTKFEALDKN